MLKFHIIFFLSTTKKLRRQDFHLSLHNVVIKHSNTHYYNIHEVKKIEKTVTYIKSRNRPFSTKSHHWLCNGWFQAFKAVQSWCWSCFGVTVPCRSQVYCWHFRDATCLHFPGEITTPVASPILTVHVHCMGIKRWPTGEDTSNFHNLQVLHQCLRHLHHDIRFDLDP
jgi:hypothetical protein